MRILYLCGEEVGRPSAASRHVNEMVASLRGLGHDVALVAGLPSAAWRREARAFGPDAVYARWSPRLGARLAWHRGFRVPVVLEINGILREELEASGVSALERWRLGLAERIGFGAAAGAAAPTEGVRRHLLDRFPFYPDRVAVIPNGVDPERFSPRDRAECRRALGLPPDRKYVLFAGSFQPWHGVDTMLSAFAAWARREPAAMFLLVGDGPLRAEAQRLAGELGVAASCRFPGAVAPGDVPLWIGAADACVCLFKPVRTDPGSPIKLFEFLACGRPVVVSDVPEYAEPVRAGGAGRTVPVDGAAAAPAVAAAWAELLSLEDGRRAELGEAGRLWVEANATWAHRGRALADFLEQVIRSAG